MIPFHPLAARLKHYRFAWLMVGSDSLDPDIWQPTNLHRLPMECLNTWEKLLVKTLPVTRIRARQPLVSASLKRLKRARSQRPHRALVWLTPPSPILKPNPLLHHLGQPAIGFDRDHEFPLLWLARHPLDTARGWGPILPIRADPRRIDLRRLRGQGQTVWPDEAGRLVLQEQCFKPQRDWSVNRQTRSEYDAVVTSLISHHRTYVIARRTSSLRQFASDVRRMGSSRVRVVFAPDWPHPDDPQPRMVALTLDQARALRDPQPWPVIHLDRRLHTWHLGAKKWIAPVTVEVTRVIRIHGATTMGQRSRFGWHLAFTDCTPCKIKA